MNNQDNPFKEDELRLVSIDVTKKENNHLEIINEFEKPPKPLNLSAANRIMGDSPLYAQEITQQLTAPHP